MRAVLRLNTFDEDLLTQSADQLSEFDRIHAEQPGFAGNMTIDLGGGRRVVLNLWQSEAAQRAGLEVLAPVVERLVNPLLVAPSELIGEGDVVSMALTPPAPA